MTLFGFKKATISECKQYRYDLWRIWDPKKQYALFIGLNPSTADEIRDDRTVLRCVEFAKKWGYGALCMANIFAFRATLPADMYKAEDPIGPQNNKFLKDLAAGAGIVIAAWGFHGKYMERESAVSKMIDRMHCLGTTKNGSPRHPLYIKGDKNPEPYNFF